MAAPTSALPPLDEHSAAKHRILRAYLVAWLQIIADRNEKLVLIDGFAGPGRAAPSGKRRPPRTTSTTRRSGSMLMLGIAVRDFRVPD
jgi:three-Cys-motif partner protein